MATIDTSIYQGLLQAPKSVADYDAEAVKTQQNRLALQLQQGQLAAQQAGVARTNKLATVLGGFAPGLSTAEQGDALTRSGFIDEGRKVIESGAKANKDEREGDKAKREAEKFQFENARDQLGFVNQIIGSAKDQASYTQGRQAMAARGLDVSQIPEQFDPAYVQSAGAQTLTQLQRLEQVWKQKGFDLDTQKFGETVRSNKAGEGLTARGQNMASDTANKRLAFDKAKEAGSEDSALGPMATRMIAQQYLAGDNTALGNIGRGTQGAKNLTIVRNEVARQANAQGLNGADVAAKMAEFQGMKAGNRTLGTRTANIEVAAAEAAELAPLALAASTKVSRSGVLPFGKAQIMFDANTNNPDMREFAMANNALVNAFGQVMSRGGAATVSDKEHARELLSTAFDQPSYARAVGQLQKEIQAAQRAPGKVRKEMSNAASGRAGEHPEQNQSSDKVIDFGSLK